MTVFGGHQLSEDLIGWLDAKAQGLNEGSVDAAVVVPRLAEEGLFALGVPEERGGRGGPSSRAVEAVAAVSSRSLAAGFVFWGQRCFIEFLLRSPNRALGDRLLPDLLAGRVAGATALSNAMKFLAGIEQLEISARREGEDHLVLDGRMPWVTNLRKQGFFVAAAVASADGRSNFVVALPHDIDGLERTDDFDLFAMQSTNTAAITLKAVKIDRRWLLHENAQEWLPRIRPFFLSLQCGLAVGLAERSLAEARAFNEKGRGILIPEIAAAEERLFTLRRDLLSGLDNGVYLADAPALFRLKIALSDLAVAAAGLENQAAGGRCYLASQPLTFGRRWREAAFIPIVTPSLVQLKGALSAYAAAAKAS